MNSEKEEIMLDLLCKKAVEGLNGTEERELTELLRNSKSDIDLESLELTAATLAIHGLDASAEMPANLRSRVLAEAERYFDDLPAVQDRDSVPAAASRSWINWLGWAVAAAACVALAVNLYSTRQPAGPITARVATPTPVERPNPEQMRQRLIDTAPDVARAEWAAGNMKEVSPAGDVVWSDSQKVGYMRFRGLPPNDPNRETYQLWIFDESQDDKTPIDGGVFDVNSDGEVIIPIDAKLSPQNVKMFAVTVEKPGGVVVSKREKIAALAKVETRTS